MDELTAFDGECFLTRLDDGSLRIDRADPRILISLELLDEIVCGEPPELNIRVRDEHDVGPGCWNGAVITIRAVNQTVIYRLKEFVPGARAYAAEWPD